MTTKALFITAKGGALLPYGPKTVFTAAASDICTATAHGFQTGAGPYKVMNNVADAPAGLVEAVHSFSFFVCTSPIATDTITIAGKAYTYIATPAADGDIDVGAATTVGTAKSMANLAAAINRDILAAATTYDLDTARNDSVKAVITDVAATTILRIVARTLDATLGDAITLASTGGTMVADNATLENGASGTDYWVIRLSADTFSLATTKALAEAGTAVDITDAGTGITTLVSTVTTVAEAMEEVLLGSLTATGARVYPAAHNIAKFWQSQIDGSVLADIS
jgi:hypothetical protein